ncbi:MAG TPA: transglutaminase domain-containing protein [Ktedonobacterales bacterium]|nr:transglutaminase domain-containing protein [Ktedonobacterales bacterium]
MQATKTLVRPSVQPDEPARPWLRLLPEDGILTILLLVIVVFTTIASIQSVTPPWAPGLDVLTGTTALGLLLGYLTVQQGRLPGTLTQFVAMAVGIFFAFHQTAVAVVDSDSGALWTRTAEWFHRAILLHQSSDDNAVFLLFLAILSFLLAFISIWLVIHTRRPWLAALANGVVLLINLNWSTEDKTIFFLVIYLLATLLLLVRFTLAENMRQWRARGLRFSPDLSWDFMQAGSIFAVIVLLLAYLLPSWPANSALTDWWNSPTNPWSAVQQRFEEIFNGVQGKGPGVINFFGGDLQLTGTVNLPTTVILRYTVPPNAGNDSTQYLVTRTLNVYNGQNAWTSSQTQIHTFGPGETEPPTTESAHLNTYDLTIATPQSGSPLFAPGDEAASFNVPSQAFQDVATGNGVAWISPNPLGPGDHYQTSGYVSNATKDQLRSVPYPSALSVDQRAALFPDSVLAEYLNNTPQVPQDVVNLTQQIVTNQKATTMYDAAEAIEAYLRNFTYTLSIQSPPPGEDAISWFLKQKQGFCTYFATTMAIMGRVLGMPTRIALGFSSGKYDSTTNSFVVRGTQAHVWPQIYFGSYGWINFEPTSSFDPFARATNSGAAGGSQPTVNPNGSGATPGGTPHIKNINDPNGGSSPTSPNQANPVLVDAGLTASLVIVLLLLFALFLSIWWRLIFRGLSPVTAAFARIARLGTWAGAPPRRSETPDEYAEHLALVIPSQRPALMRLSALYSRERYGGGTPEETAREAPRLYDAVRRSVSTVIVRRLRPTPGGLFGWTRRSFRRHRQDN